MRGAETRGARQVLDAMKGAKPQTAAELADRLSMSPVGMRLHLNDLERKGLVEAEWGMAESNRQARFYSLTRKGRKQLADETENWQRFAGAVARILQDA